MVQGLISGAGSGSVAAAGATGGLSSTALGAARFGTSTLSALSGYAMSQSNAQALDMESFDESLAARQDYVQAQQKTNQIQRAYNDTIGAQLAATSASGIDIGSGSVQEAGRQAGQQRDRVVQAAQSSAQIDANLRTARAKMLAQSASMTRTTGVLSGILDVAKAGLQFASLGG